MQDLDKIFHVHLINAKVRHCLSIFQNIEKNTIGKNFHNHFSDPFTEIQDNDFIFVFLIKNIQGHLRLRVGI